MDLAFLSGWLGSVPLAAMPLLLACVGLILSERAGVVSLGIEGYLAMGAMTSAVLILQGAPVWLGVAAAMLAGMLLALGFGVAVVLMRAEQVLAGLATMAIGLGLAGLLGRSQVHRPFEGLAPLDVGALAGLPLIGPLLFRQDALTYGALALCLLLGWALAHTRLGLRIRAVGEDPATADVAGVNVPLHQLLAVACCGALGGLAGAYLSVVASNVWVENMVAGRGWIALALVIFARWSPVRAIFGAFFFGAVEALLPRLQAIGWEAPVYLMGMLPYALTILVLAISACRAGHAQEPAALGVAYLRQDRR
ncbi:ABC transporter permease [Corticibacter populi]|uniref:ABC transporter permease n=1 Tax=Corticibacter populi TaxID=1550736 RepID=A0A3M6QPD9_9BURK|nr:ABC transporter permease [Corticibacter populi]RMX04930.1 ABC transporter permease [Corticibacter populi]RZS33645.1 nucleoside ABC transporter membrane protein [Corticibacter populi]